MAIPISRRTFLKTGLIGAIGLTAAGTWYRMTGSAPAGKFMLDAEAGAALGAIAAAMLQDAMPANPAAVRQAVSRVQAAIAGLPLRTQAEIQDLFALLTFGVARRLLTGISGNWQNADPRQVAAFLQDWRTHGSDTLQSAYHALHDLIIGSWYADESTWAAIGYPGPLKELSGP